MTKYNFGRDAFRVWLRNNLNTKFRRNSSCACPLAKFARIACGLPKATIDTDVITYGKERYATKPWMARFINEVDYGPGNTVKGKEAYRILNRISRGPNG